MIRVFLKPATRPDSQGRERFFVEVEGFPGSTTIVVSRGLLREDAEEQMRVIEDALDAYRRPKRKRRANKPRTSWDRILRAEEGDPKS
jgi:hypothetical protein